MNTLTHYQRLARDAAAYQAAERRRRTMANCFPVTISIDGVAMEAWLTADRDLEMLLVGGVDMLPAMDTMTGGRKEFWAYFDTLVEAALQAEAAERQDAADEQTLFFRSLEAA